MADRGIIPRSDAFARITAATRHVEQSVRAERTGDRESGRTPPPRPPIWVRIEELLEGDEARAQVREWDGESWQGTTRRETVFQAAEWLKFAAGDEGAAIWFHRRGYGAISVGKPTHSARGGLFCRAKHAHPAFSVLEVQGAEADGTLVVEEPGHHGKSVNPCLTDYVFLLEQTQEGITDEEGNHLGSGVAPCTAYPPAWARYNSGAGTPRVGDIWGPIAESDVLHQVGQYGAQCGWRVLHVDTADHRVYVSHVTLFEGD